MDGTSGTIDSGITRQIFDETIAALRQSLNEVRGVVDALARQIGETQQGQQRVLDQIAIERKEREGAISRIENDVAEIGIRQEKQLAEMDNKLDALTNSMERVHGTLSNFTAVLEVRDRSIAEQGERIKQAEARAATQERSITLVTTTQAAITTELKALTGAIYGSNERPDVESLMKSMRDLRTDVRSGFAGQAGQIESLRAEQAALMARQEKIEQSIEAQARKWADRRAKITGYFLKLISDPKFWYAVGGGTGIAAMLPQETKEIIVHLIKTLLGI